MISSTPSSPSSRSPSNGTGLYVRLLPQFGQGSTTGAAHDRRRRRPRPAARRDLGHLTGCCPRLALSPGPAPPSARPRRLSLEHQDLRPSKEQPNGDPKAGEGSSVSERRRPSAGRRRRAGSTLRAAAAGAGAARQHSVHSELQQGTNQILRLVTWVMIPAGLLLIVKRVLSAATTAVRRRGPRLGGRGGRPWSPRAWCC